MLVLGANVESKVYIVDNKTNETITVKFVEQRGKEYIKLGFDAGDRFSIYREKVYDRTFNQQEKKG